MPTLIPLAQVPAEMIETLLDRAFGPERHARTAYAVREGSDWLPALSFAALDEEEHLVGTIQLWPVALTDRRGRAHPLLMVGPVAVEPGLQGAGYGKALMTAALGSIDPQAPLPQVLIGDESDYGRWGFSADRTGGWRCPGPYDPSRLLARCENPSVLPEEGTLGPWRGQRSDALAN